MPAYELQEGGPDSAAFSLASDRLLASLSASSHNTLFPSPLLHTVWLSFISLT